MSLATRVLRRLALYSLIALVPHVAAEPAQRLPGHDGIAAGIVEGMPPPVIDGLLDDSAWASAAAVSRFYQYQPEDGLLAPDGYRTQVRVFMDRQALVFAIRAWHPPGETPLGTLARRDKVARDQDYVGIWIDPTGHGRSAQFVRVNVAGVQGDGIYRADEDEEDLGPDFPVESAVRRLDDGYSIELRWPLSSLRFPHGAAKPWRLMVERSVPGAGGMLLLSSPLDKNALSFIAEMDEINNLDGILPAVRDQGFWSFRPELTTRRSRGPEGKARDTNLGLDIVARPRADWVFNATLNPDFSQVEIDEPTSAGTTDIALSLPEKRAFFLESSDVLGMRLPAFYSRAIADPAWGARATFRGAASDATALTAGDDPGGVVLRGSPYATDEYVNTARSTVALLRGRLHGDSTVTGAFLAARDYGDGGRDTVAGVDGQWRGEAGSGGTVQVAWSLMGSQNTARFADSGVPSRGAGEQGAHAWAKADWLTRDWANALQLEAITANFVNDNGFVPQRGLVKGELQVNRRLGPRSFGAIDTYETELHLGIHEQRTLHGPWGGAGEVVQRWIRPGFWLYGPRQTRLWADLGIDHQRAGPGGRLHRTPVVYIGVESSPFPWLVKLAGELTVGRQLDVDADAVGRGGTLEAQASLRLPLPGGWSLESDHRWNRSWVRHRSRQDYRDYGWRWVGTLHATARDSLRAIVQNTSSSRLAGDLPGAESGNWPWFAGLEPGQERQRHRSLLYRHIPRHGRSLSVGATSDANGALPGNSRVVTVKLQWES
ncbi:hypothetical protein [Pseudoduganella buxea]|uniref:Carbohydrate-binding domain-containing protein n=1 Tax=Pseudoduganella buxea TaxID=1949069 RepID=A0A6I3SYL2_9BURK|nr:hypothetical protein [Pseudoduganella buxea]MTV52707.1 hypothetical protein [Pseudoduganella buxea]GGC18771.1 hypothetical protein GCM10011572_45310 [Pseudoduganella buxea]